ncbi:hypothetical protein MSAN_01612800 [Mycena sanguinolenta]|uniref:Uncharacterized protein n=1 Tax=Mycena sanguinolenta TaxID=230812 RepID=A0A8H6Y3L2_9AGAR|nr:hypothetical protein MSAN_01612800 [Mycena sanguinolenta]
MLHRSASDITHVSDSEPEREALRRRLKESRNGSQSSSPCQSPTPAPSRAPLTTISNTPKRLQHRLSVIDKRLTEVEQEVRDLRSEFNGLAGSLTREEDVVLVRLFKKSRWQPKTAWENCRVLEDGRTMLILAKYFIRGVHLINAFGCAKESTTYYLNDLVDNDWFLRAGN